MNEWRRAILEELLPDISPSCAIKTHSRLKQTDAGRRRTAAATIRARGGEKFLGPKGEGAERERKDVERGKRVGETEVERESETKPEGGEGEHGKS